MKKVFIFVVVGLTLVMPAFARSLFYDELQPVAQPSVVDKTFADASYAMKTFNLKYARAGSVKEALQGVLAQGEGVSVNEQLNFVVVRASKSNLASITKVIQDMDVTPLQVQVEAKIIELKSNLGDTNNPNSLGMSWKYSHSSNDYVQSLTTNTLTTAATSLGLYAQLLSGNVNAYLQALQNTAGYNLVASPWVTALNHDRAEILIGSKYGYKTLIQTQTSTVQEVHYLEVGTRLSFTPHINEDGYILMEIYPSVSEGSVVNDLPNENTTETRNKVLVKDGQSIVIGGLSKKYDVAVDVGVPFLSSLPWIGSVFRNTSIIKETRELMVIITPHIVTPRFLTEMANKARAMETKAQTQYDKDKLIH